jgi:pantetheine-phosphate adenylyltransferase
MRVAVYPGSFDPVTYGHLDILERATLVFDKVIMAVLENPGKAPLFSTEERVELIRSSVADHPRLDRIDVGTFSGLTVDYARHTGATAIVRGLRAVSDFENEFQMALMNRRLNPHIETVFMMPAEQYTYISSRLIKEVFALGGGVHGLVPDLVEQRLRQKV